MNRLESTLNHNDIYLFGPMGSGKTTLVDNLKDSFPESVNYVSIGAIVREKLAQEDAEATRIIESGKKIPLSYVAATINPYISTERSYILDGVPRHIDEAEWIKIHIDQREMGALAVILSANTNVLLQRIYDRARNGDRKETSERIRNRLSVYQDNINKIIDIIEPSLDEIIEIDATASSEAVYAKAKHELETLS